jgi:glycosyltransferase involved in cell wall biosynthesis
MAAVEAPTHSGGSDTALLVVPPGRWPLDIEVADCRARHGDCLSVVLVWCGDPQLRPPAPVDAAYAPLPVGWELLLASEPPSNLLRIATDFAVDELRKAGIGELVVDAPRHGVELPLRLPGGAALDEPTRRVVASALQSGRAPDAPPHPWRAPAAFRAWLAPRYAANLRALPLASLERLDLLRASRVELDRAIASATASEETVDTTPSGLTVDGLTVLEPLRTDGFNLVGYLTLEMSLGDVARRIGDTADAAGVGAARIAHLRAGSPPLDLIPRIDQEVRFDTTVAVITADQFQYFADDYPTLFKVSKKMIGYWFWELEHIPQPMIDAINLVDEIWAGSRFVTQNFAAVTDKPVRYLPISVPEPTPSAKDRSAFPKLRGLDGRPIFLVVFDYFSIMERKNPIGAIDAFRRAFRLDEGPILIVKSMNGDQCAPQQARVRSSAAGRADVVLWDEQLSREDQMALMRAADCVVSLHRSEGLGLHLAEAMWLGTPTIATRYSGNLDFQDDDCALLVNATPTRITHGQGVYPETATWADPDLNQAAGFMRRIVAEPDLRSKLAEAGRKRMERQPSPAETGAAIAAALGIRS